MKDTKSVSSKNNKDDKSNKNSKSNKSIKKSVKPLFCILGASGSGKTTMCEGLEKALGLRQIPSYTTRPPRYENEPGHIFINDRQYGKLKVIVAENITTGYKYCITQGQINNQRYDLYVVDLTGLKVLKKNYHGGRPIVTIWLETPLRQRYDRLKARYLKHIKDIHDPESVEKAINSALERIVSDAVEFTGYEKYCKYIIDNSDGNFDRAFDRLLYIVTDGQAGQKDDV